MNESLSPPPSHSRSQPLSHVLLDIEGTTCPVRFVSETLFPYAAAHLGSFLNAHSGDAAVRDLVAQVEQAWREDPAPAAQTLRAAASADEGEARRVLPYLQWLITQDRKLTPLKDLQGLVWEAGYRSGELQGPLYDDVAPALRRWRAAGLGLAVYSSGSVAAQKLIYGHSTAGDLRDLFGHWFDTRIGSKLEPSSYERICAELGVTAAGVLFISDSLGELQAAHTAGLPALFSDRSEGESPPAANGEFPRIRSFAEVEPMVGALGRERPPWTPPAD